MKFKLTLREILLLTTVIALIIAFLIYRFGDGPHAHRLPYSRSAKELVLRVIAADDFSPVAGVEVSLTWVGKGADGGGHGRAVTDKNGIARLPGGFMSGPIQVYLTAPQGGRFRNTSFTKNHDMLTGRPDGTYYPSVFRMDIASSKDPNFKDH